MKKNIGNKKQSKSIHKKESKSESSRNNDSKDYKEIANFIRRLKP
jgi:hypothetical protein